jgi:hypothetical protein
VANPSANAFGESGAGLEQGTILLPPQSRCRITGTASVGQNSERFSALRLLPSGLVFVMPNRRRSFERRNRLIYRYRLRRPTTKNP